MIPPDLIVLTFCTKVLFLFSASTLTEFKNILVLNHFPRFTDGKQK